jgi:replicative DNA helicase
VSNTDSTVGEVYSDTIHRATNGAPASEREGWACPHLDKLLRGLKAQEFVVVAGNPGAGKTSFVLDVLRRRVAAGYGKAHIFTFEMPKLQLVQKLASMQSGIPFDFLDRGFPEEKLSSGLERLDETLQWLSANFGISDERIRPFKPRDFIDFCIDLAPEYKAGFFVDYIQLLGGDNNELLTEWSDAFRVVALRTGVPVFTASSLSKEWERRNKDVRATSEAIPSYADLRGSGSIGYFASKVLFLNPDESVQGSVKLHVLKNRFGVPFKCLDLSLCRLTQRFEVKEF